MPRELQRVSIQSQDGTFVHVPGGVQSHDARTSGAPTSTPANNQRAHSEDPKYPARVTDRGMASAAVCCMGIQHTAAYSSIQQKMRVRMRGQKYSNTAAFPYSIQQKNCCMLLYGGHTADDSIQQIPMISGVTNPYHGGYRSHSVAETCFRAHTSI